MAEGWKQIKDENVSLKRSNIDLINENRKLSEENQKYLEKWTQALTLAVQFQNDARLLDSQNKILTKELEESSRRLREVDVKIASLIAKLSFLE